MARALHGLAGVIDPREIGGVKGWARLHVADWLPAFVNAARVLVAVGAISMFWIVSAWPNGVTAITFCAVIVILLSLQGDVAYSASMTFLQGTAISAIAAALVLFGFLPKATTFPSLCLVLGLVLVPFGVLIALPWRYSFLFTAATFNFVPMLNITNGMDFDASQFWNGASAILVGIAVGAIAMLIIPPLSPTIRAQAAARPDARRPEAAGQASRARDGSAIGKAVASPACWRCPTRPSRSSAPSSRPPSPSARRSCAFATSPRGSSRPQSSTGPCRPLRRGEAAKRLSGSESSTAGSPPCLTLRPAGRILLSLRASILAISGQLSQYAFYFDQPIR